tara:strand:+ start:175 stop:762 length:588 start_codon:yes stop_codon:yes gene_type:complete
MEPIEGFYRDFYSIDRDGRVFGHKSKKILKPSLNAYGYPQVSLSRPGARETFRIHRLVAINFIPNPRHCLYVDHINRDRTDHRIENLRWVTCSENSRNRTTSNPSGHIGVIQAKETGTWVASIWTGEKFHSMSFRLLDDAIAWRKKMEAKLPRIGGEIDKPSKPLANQSYKEKSTESSLCTLSVELHTRLLTMYG